MNILFICSDCNRQSEGILKKRTRYDNTTNMDELDICCRYCGKVLAKSFTSMSLTEDAQKELWEENKNKNKKKEI